MCPERETDNHVAPRTGTRGISLPPPLRAFTALFLGTVRGGGANFLREKSAGINLFKKSALGIGP